MCRALLFLERLTVAAFPRSDGYDAVRRLLAERWYSSAAIAGAISDLKAGVGVDGSDAIDSEDREAVREAVAGEPAADR